MTKDEIAAVLERVRSWPREDQAEFMELAREIEARRNGDLEPLGSRQPREGNDKRP